MTEPDLLEAVLDELPRLMLERFRTAGRRWQPGDVFEEPRKPWVELYEEIESVRMEPTIESLCGLADQFRQSGVLDTDDRGRLLHADALNFQVTACHAVAETLVRKPEREEWAQTTSDLLAICPPTGWIHPYFDLLAELRDEDGDPGLAADLAVKAFQMAEAAGDKPEVLRPLRRAREALRVAGDAGKTAPASKGLPDGVELPASTELPDLLVAEDIAGLLRVDKITARRFMTNGSIPSKKFGRRRYTRKSDLLDLFKPEK